MRAILVGAALCAFLLAGCGGKPGLQATVKTGPNPLYSPRTSATGGSPLAESTKMNESAEAKEAPPIEPAKAMTLKDKYESLKPEVVFDKWVFDKERAKYRKKIIEVCLNVRHISPGNRKTEHGHILLYPKGHAAENAGTLTCWFDPSLNSELRMLQKEIKSGTLVRIRGETFGTFLDGLHNDSNLTDCGLIQIVP
jgi:hypothetical protein